MKNTTLSADEQLIEQARLLAKSQHKTLNAMFREWLEQFTAQNGSTKEFDALMKRLKHVQAGRRVRPEEMNEGVGVSRYKHLRILLRRAFTREGCPTQEDDQKGTLY